MCLCGGATHPSRLTCSTLSGVFVGQCRTSITPDVQYSLVSLISRPPRPAFSLVEICQFRKLCRFAQIAELTPISNKRPVPCKTPKCSDWVAQCLPTGFARAASSRLLLPAEALLVADHNAYHLGQLVIVRRALNEADYSWTEVDRIGVRDRARFTPTPPNTLMPSVLGRYRPNHRLASSLRPNHRLSGF